MSLSMLYGLASTQVYTTDETTDEIIGSYMKIRRKKPVPPPPEIREGQAEPAFELPVVVYELYSTDSVAFQINTEAFPRSDIDLASKVDRAALIRLQESPAPRLSPVRPPNDHTTLQFNSQFESGNLQRATKLNMYEYQLELRTDTNTDRHNHWYYFSVHNPIIGKVAFHIVNMLKFDYLYTAGMKPAVYSVKKEQFRKAGWHREGSAVTYTKNEAGCYTLSFTYEFQYADDTVYFAYSVPYTHSELCRYTAAIKEEHTEIARVDPVCTTLGGNVCEMVTITNNMPTYTSFEEELQMWGLSASGRRILRNRKLRMGKGTDEHSTKKGVVITARVHSGEAVSSYMALGVLNFLLGNSREARLLRDHFVFKIVPMLNPDGVIYGNYRCSLLGIDLNRRWKAPNKSLHPTIFYVKKMMEVFQESHQLSLYCDLHGHTRQRNVFMYGCSVKSNEVLDIRRNLLAKVIPTIFEQKNPFFSMKNSHFSVHPSKEATGRVVVFRQFGVSHSYTMEASFYGPSSSKSFGKHFTGDLHMQPAHLQGIGKDLCKMCLTFISPVLYSKRVIFTAKYLRKQWLPKEKAADIDLKFSELKGSASVAKPVEEEMDCWDSVELVDFNSSSGDDSGSDSDVTVDIISESSKSVEPVKTPVRTPVSTAKLPDKGNDEKKVVEPPPLRLHVKRNSVKVNRPTLIEYRKQEIEQEALPMNQLNLLDFFKHRSDPEKNLQIAEARKTRGKNKVKPRPQLNKLSLPKMNLKNSIISARARPTSETNGIFYQAQTSGLDFSGTSPKELARSLAMHKRYLAHKLAVDTRHFDFK